MTMTGVKNLSAQWRRIFSAGVSLVLLFGVLNSVAWDVSAQEPQESILYPWEGISEPQEPISYPWDGVSDPQQPISQPPQPSPSTPVCHETQDAPYGQCGSDVLSFGRTTDSGGNPIISTHQYEVIRIRNAANVCGALSYTAVDRGEAGVCGASPAPPPTGGPPPAEPPPSQYQSYSACGQSGQLWVGGGYRPLQPSDCTGNTFLKIYRDGSGYITNVCEAVPSGYVRDSDGCGASPASLPTSGPVSPPIVSCGRQEIDEGCTDNGVRQFRTLDTCGGFSSVRRVWDAICARGMVDGCQESVASSFCSSPSFRTDRVRNTCTGEFTRTVFDTGCRGPFPFFVGSDGGIDGCFSSFVGSECTSFGIRADVIESNCRGRFQTNFRPDTSCGAAPPVTCDEVFLRTECVDNTGLSVDLFRNSCTGNLVQRNMRRVATCGVPTAAVVVSQPTTQVTGQPVTSVVTREVREVPREVRVVTTQAQPQVVLVAGGEIKQLPKTGLPALSYALLGLIPLGWKLRKFGSFNQKLTQDNHYLWEEKRFKREIKDKTLS